MDHQIATESLELAIEGGSSAMNVHVAWPTEPGTYPSCIVCGELFGLTSHIRDVTERIARLGYVALAPDFYHRTSPNVHLAYTPEGREQGFALLRQLRRSEVLDDVRAAIEYLRARPDTTSMVGIVGFSLGGHMAYLAATQFDLAIAVSFYGGWIVNSDIPLSQPEPPVALTPGIAEHDGRVLYFIGGLDHAISADQITPLKEALSGAGVRHEIVVYPNVQHGFFCNERDTFDEATRDDSWERTKTALAEELG